MIDTDSISHIEHAGRDKLYIYNILYEDLIRVHE